MDGSIFDGQKQIRGSGRLKESVRMAKTRGVPFEVGNTMGRGRPKGSRNKSTLAAQELFGENADAVARKCIKMALKGDPVAMRLCMERIHPVRRAMPVRFHLPKIRNRQDAVAALNSVVQAVAKGELAPAEGQQILPFVETILRLLTSEEFDKRLNALEEQFGVTKLSRLA